MGNCLWVSIVATCFDGVHGANDLAILVGDGNAVGIIAATGIEAYRTIHRNGNLGIHGAVLGIFVGTWIDNNAFGQTTLRINHGVWIGAEFDGEVLEGANLLGTAHGTIDLDVAIAASYDDSITVKAFFLGWDESSFAEAKQAFKNMYDRLYPGEW